MIGLTLVFAAAMSGCGPDYPETVPVSGTVTLDGEPVAGAAVMFVPTSGGRPGTGVTDDQGRYTLTTFEDSDGALPNEHRVAVDLHRETPTYARNPVGEAYMAGARITWIVPEKYSRIETSGLQAAVTGSRCEHNFDLKTGN